MIECVHSVGERPKSWPAPGKLEWTIHAKTESGEVDYEKLLFFPLPGMKALCSALGFDALLGPFQPTSVTSGESVEAFETLAVTLGPDCTTKGVGLGLDPHNVIDMLVPGKTAADMLQIGDRIIQWNGRSLTDLRTGLPKKLASVVDSNLDTHAVVVERPRLTLSGAEKTALIMEATRRSGCETDGCEAGEIAGLAKRAAPAAEEATDSAFSAVESALRGEGLEVPAPKAALEKIVEEAKVVE